MSLKEFSFAMADKAELAISKVTTTEATSKAYGKCSYSGSCSGGNGSCSYGRSCGGW